MKRRVILSMAYFLLGATAAHADDDARFSLLGRLNRNVVVEGAGSHGSWGLWTGASVSSVSMDSSEASGWKTTSGSTENSDSSESRSMSQIHLVKGTPWPVDFGISAGQTSDGIARRFGGYAQWTAYQQLARPAVALRASYSRLLLDGHGEANSQGLEGITSMGLMRYFQIYGGWGIFSHTATLSGSTQETLALTSIRASTPDESRQWTDWSASAGVQIRIFSPFFFLAIEDRVDKGNARTVTGKASFAM